MCRPIMRINPSPSQSALKARLCIHIPTYNVSEFLLATVRRIPWDMLQSVFPTVLFVDNASQDGTLDEIVRARSELSAAGITTHAIVHSENRCYGGSLKSAFAYAASRCSPGYLRHASWVT